MVRRNYKSDFQCVVPLVDATGQEVLFPDFDWHAQFWTASRGLSYVAQCNSGTMRNAYINEQGRVVMVFDGHGLPPGRLKMEFTVEVPDGNFPDGCQRVVAPMELGIELVRERTEYSEAEVEAAVPVIIRSALEAEVEAFGQVLDRINDKLEEILEGKEVAGSGSTDGSDDSGSSTHLLSAAPAGPAVVQRGMISMNAAPGVVYRNLGFIRVPVKWNRDGVTLADIDISGVDMKMVRGVVVCGNQLDEGGAEISGLTVDEDNKILHVELDCAILGLGADNLPSLRLQIAQREDGHESFLMKGVDGVIRQTAFAAIENRRQPPEIKQRVIVADHELASMDELANALCGAISGEVEIQKKKRRCPGHGSAASKWQRVNMKNGVRLCGVFRMRFKRKGRRPASGWTVFSYHYSYVSSRGLYIWQVAVLK